MLLVRMDAPASPERTPVRLRAADPYARLTDTPTHRREYRHQDRHAPEYNPFPMPSEDECTESASGAILVLTGMKPETFTAGNLTNSAAVKHHEGGSAQGVDVLARIVCERDEISRGTFLDAGQPEVVAGRP